MNNPVRNTTEFGDPSKKLILVIDDDESIVDLIERAVKQHGFKVERALDGKIALAKAQTLRPSLIILDFMLPGLSGLELIHQLQVEETVGIPIIAITGRRIDQKNIQLIRQEPNIR